MTFVVHPRKKKTTARPSDMTKNMSDMKLPRSRMSGAVKTFKTLPIKTVWPGYMPAANV
jgi:hypothetical protein